jgi:NitT/TauT family transport system substrate-binding protein
MIRIGHLSTFYHTSALLIAGNSLGTEAEWSLFGTGPAIVNALEKGTIDLAYLGLPPAIIGIDRGVNIKCIAGGHIEGTVIIGTGQLKGFPEINDFREILKQLNGQKIGVPGKGSIHDVIISERLERLSLAGEIEILNFQWADQILEAFHNNEVSAAVGTPALAVAVKKYANGKVLYPPSMLWPNNPSYGILINSSLLDRQSESIRNFLVLHEESTAFFREKPFEAAKLISDYVGIVDDAFVLDTLKVSPKYCACLTAEYIECTMAFVQALKKLGYIKRSLSSDEIFDMSLIKQIHPSKDHYGEGLMN